MNLYKNITILKSIGMDSRKYTYYKPCVYKNHSYATTTKILVLKMTRELGLEINSELKRLQSKMVAVWKTIKRCWGLF